MFKKIPLYLIIMLFVFTSLFAQENIVKIISVDLSDQSKLNSLEQMNLPVIDLNENSLITYVTDDKLAYLKSLSIFEKQLSRSIDLNKLYLITGKKNQKVSQINFGNNEIVKLFDKVIIHSETKENIENEKLKKIPLTEIKRTFKNIKTIYNTVQSNKLDSLITSITTDVDTASVRNYIQGLQDFGTRFLRHPNRKEVALWIKDKFESMGYNDVVLDSFMVGSYRQYNVVATYPASVPTDKVIVVGGHHDSITQQSLSNTSTPAPGADDNASGTTAALESARVLMENSFPSEVNIKFVTFAAEELGLYGAFDYAEKAANSGIDIKLMINHDMISSTRRSLESSVVDINHYSGSEAFAQIALQSVGKFTGINSQLGQSNSSGSDSYAFWSNGFNAVYFEESDFSSYYHTSEDLIHHYSMPFCTEVIKASVATLISASVAPSLVDNFVIADSGDGSTLVLNWNANTDPDVIGYKIYVGTSEGNYDSEFQTNNTSYKVTGLTEGVLYHIGVSALDAEGYESFIVERTKIPNSFPMSPKEFTVEPRWHSVELNWIENEELDIIGYNIYRATEESDDFAKLNEEIIQSISFLDDNLLSGVYYKYFVRAVDNELNESQNTEEIISRGVTLDQGILLVDETADGDGSLFSPTDEEVDEFYKNAISSFIHSEFDLKTKTKIDLSDLGAYNVIIWYGDDKTDQSSSSFVPEIQKYLDFGGKIIYSGYRPSKTFANVTSLTKTFSPGEFLYDYFKIDGVNYSLLAKFSGGGSQVESYPNLFLDSDKIGTGSDGHINGIETFALVDSETGIYGYQTDFAPTVAQGSLGGQTVGTAYYGEDFSTVILSFPLFYIDEQSVSNFFNYVLTEKFGLTTDVETDEENMPSEFYLSQNYPNPFNPVTRIKYQVASIEKVTLKVYDILGREVALLVNRVQSPGTYEVEFNAADLASGIYFYSIQAGEFSAVKKLMHLK
ncbi:MAG: M28 family peptidase [Ignavibacteriales bacterium]|nr:MAG: M28 family peptidase [Ignavibacteriales bacterium]